MSNSVKDINQIIAEETADVPVYAIRYFGARYRVTVRPTLEDALDDVRAMAEDTLHPGQSLEVYQDERVIARFTADLDGIVHAEVA